MSLQGLAVRLLAADLLIHVCVEIFVQKEIQNFVCLFRVEIMCINIVNPVF
jgi:hypothetical protein